MVNVSGTGWSFQNRRCTLTPRVCNSSSKIRPDGMQAAGTYNRGPECRKMVTRCERSRPVRALTISMSSMVTEAPRCPIFHEIWVSSIVISACVLAMTPQTAGDISTAKTAATMGCKFMKNISRIRASTDKAVMVMSTGSREPRLW